MVQVVCVRYFGNKLVKHVCSRPTKRKSLKKENNREHFSNSNKKTNEKARVNDKSKEKIQKSEFFQCMFSLIQLFQANPNMAENNREGQEQPGQNQHVEICRVAARIPPFNQTRPDLWFKQIESQFHVAGISQDDSKYHIVVGHIDGTAIEPIADLITNPPTVDKYNTLKTRLLAEYQDSDQKKLKKLLMDIELGDRRPMQLLKKMKELAGNSMTDDVVKSLWLQRLPSNIRAIVSAVTGDSMQMAIVADKIFEVTDFGTVAEVAYKDREENAATNRMQQQIDELTNKLAKFQHRQRSRSRARGERDRSKSKQREFENCWYHFRYGDRATKCREPCNFKKNSGN